MYYYFAWVRSSRYHGSEPLTYSSDVRLPTGSVVRIELQKEVVLGLITGPTSKPRFATKPVTSVLDLPPIPAHLIKLCSWLKEYYPAPIGIITQQLLPAKLSGKQLAGAELG